MTGNNPTDRSKLGTKRYTLTDKNGIPLSAIISSTSTHDIKTVTDVIDNSIIKQSFVSNKPKKGMKQRRPYHHHLCLDRAYNSKPIENEIIKRGYVPHIPYKRKRGQMIKNTNQKRYSLSKNKRWVVERTNSWHNRFRKLFTNTKRRLRTTLDWCNYLAVSLSIER
jgi:transposase